MTPSPPDCDGWLDAGAAPPPSPQDGGRSGSEEEQRSVTETVINGSMKETVSLTVDAKTETAVFKRLVLVLTPAPHLSESPSNLRNLPGSPSHQFSDLCTKTALPRPQWWLLGDQRSNIDVLARMFSSGVEGWNIKRSVGDPMFA